MRSRARRVAAGAALGVLLAGLLAATPARAEYRAYELEVVDLYDCRINERDECRTGRLTTALDPRQYLLTHGGPFHIGVLLLATWMCYGDTSFYKVVCPRPVTRKPRHAEGDEVRIALEKHITDGWRGVVEVAYYQHSVRSNVYGVRFPERRNVYARYFEKDLRKMGAEEGAAGAAPATTAAPTPAGGTAQPVNAPPVNTPPQ